MFLIPLNQMESVELMIHALRAAGGAAGCDACPAFRVCTKQCLAVADSIEQMVQSNSLPRFDDGPLEHPDKTPPDSSGPASGGHLRRVK